MVGRGIDNLEQGPYLACKRWYTHSGRGPTWPLPLMEVFLAWQLEHMLWLHNAGLEPEGLVEIFLPASIYNENRGVVEKNSSYTTGWTVYILLFC